MKVFEKLLKKNSNFLPYFTLNAIFYLSIE